MTLSSTTRPMMRRKEELESSVTPSPPPAEAPTMEQQSSTSAAPSVSSTPVPNATLVHHHTTATSKKRPSMDAGRSMPHPAQAYATPLYNASPFFASPQFVAAYQPSGFHAYPFDMAAYNPYMSYSPYLPLVATQPTAATAAPSAYIPGYGHVRFATAAAPNNTHDTATSHMQPSTFYPVEIHDLHHDSAGDLDAINPEIDSRICKNFKCCDSVLSDMHDLLRHWEERHARVEERPGTAPPALGSQSQNNANSANSNDAPIQSPTASMAAVADSLLETPAAEASVEQAAEEEATSPLPSASAAPSRPSKRLRHMSINLEPSHEPAAFDNAVLRPASARESSVDQQLQQYHHHVQLQRAAAAASATDLLAPNYSQQQQQQQQPQDDERYQKIQRLLAANANNAGLYPAAQSNEDLQLIYSFLSNGHGAALPPSHSYMMEQQLPQFGVPYMPYEHTLLQQQQQQRQFSQLQYGGKTVLMDVHGQVLASPSTQGIDPHLATGAPGSGGDDSDSNDDPSSTNGANRRLSQKILPTGTAERPFVCPVLGCGKTYKNANGLKYHSIHGHPTSDTAPNGQPLGKLEKPHRCHVMGCGKRYKNVNGLKYHLQHAHGIMDGSNQNMPAQQTMNMTPLQQMQQQMHQQMQHQMQQQMQMSGNNAAASVLQRPPSNNGMQPLLMPQSAYNRNGNTPSSAMAGLMQAAGMGVPQ